MMTIFMLHPTQGEQENIVMYPVITGEEVTEKVRHIPRLLISMSSKVNLTL